MKLKVKQKRKYTMNNKKPISFISLKMIEIIFKTKSLKRNHIKILTQNKTQINNRTKKIKNVIDQRKDSNN